MMPQKKNPDACELVRGKTGRVYGSLVGLLTVMKGLPLSYNKDMQEDKEGLFDALDTAVDSLRLYCAMLPRTRVNAERMRRAAASGFSNATDLADHLVRAGVPFREAHHVVGRLGCRSRWRTEFPGELTLSRCARRRAPRRNSVQCPRLETVVNARDNVGGPARPRVLAAIAAARAALKE